MILSVEKDISEIVLSFEDNKQGIDEERRSEGGMELDLRVRWGVE